jgi:hypothetical protein
MPWSLIGKEATPGAGRRLLVLPSRRRPRWVLPAGAAFAARGLDLYVPATRAGRIYKLALMFLAVSGIAAWFKSRVVIVDECSESVLAEVRKRIPEGQACDYAIFSSSGPDRKLTMQLRSPAGDAVAFAKIGETQRAKALLTREMRMLQFLSALPMAGCVPRLIAQFEHGGRAVLMQTPVQGDASGNRFTGAHWSFLSGLMLDRRMTIGQYVFDQQRLARRLASLHHDVVVALNPALLRLETARSRICRAVVLHGDFAPWNIRIECGAGQPRISVIDWEFGREAGLPLWDAIHFIVQTDALVHRARPWNILQNLKNFLNASDALIYRAAASVAKRDLVALLLAYLIDVIITGFEAAPSLTALQNVRLQLLKSVVENGLGTPATTVERDRNEDAGCPGTRKKIR